MRKFAVIFVIVISILLTFTACDTLSDREASGQEEIHQTHVFNFTISQADGNLILTSDNGLILTQVNQIFPFPQDAEQFNFTISGNIPRNSTYLIRANNQILFSVNGFAYTLFHDAWETEFEIIVDFLAPPWDTLQYRNDTVYANIATNFMLDVALRRFFDDNYDAILAAAHLLDIDGMNYAAAQGHKFDYAPELIAISDLFVEAFIQGFEADELTKTFPFNSDFVRRIFADYTFVFNPEFSGGSAGFDNINIGVNGFGNGSDDWVIHVTLHEIGHALGLGESLAEVFSREFLNAQWVDSPDWVYTTIFDYPLMQRVGRAEFFRVAFTSNHTYITLWMEHFGEVVDFQRLALARSVLFNDLGYTQEDVQAFIGKDFELFWTMVFERSLQLFQNHAFNGDANGHSELNEFIDLLVDFGMQHYVAYTPPLFQERIYDFHSFLHEN